MITIKILPFIRNISIDRRVFQIGVIIVTVLTAIVIAYWGTMKILVLSIALVVSFPLLFFLIKYPNLGFIFILLTGWFVPFSGPGGFNASMLMIILMFVLWLLDMFIVKRKFEFVHSRALRPVVYFMTISVIAFGVGQIRWFTFANQAPLDVQIGGFAVYFFLVAVTLLTANILRDIRWLKAIILVFIGLGTLYVLLSLANVPGLDRIFSRGAYVNGMFWTWLVALPAGQAIFNDGLKFKHRVVLFAIIAATLYSGIQNSEWKSGWVPPAVAVGVLVALRFKKLTLLAIPFALIVAGFFIRGLIATDEWSWGTRVDAWIVVLNMSKISPFIGLGFANYFWYAGIFTLRGYHSRFNSHSQYVDIIAQTGIAGLFCFAWVMFEIGSLSLKIMRRSSTGFERGYAYAVFAGMFGSLMAAFLGDWVLPFAYNVGIDGVRASVLPWIFFGALVAIEQLNKDKLILQ